MEGDSSHDCYNVPVSCCTCTDNGILDLQHRTLSSQPMGTLTHLSTVQSTQPKAKTGMSIMYFNARSIMPKFDELCAIVQSSQLDIICLSHGLATTSRTRRLTFLATFCIVLIGIAKGGGIVLY